VVKANWAVEREGAMDLFKRKSKDVAKEKKDDRNTIGAMERGAVAHMMKSGKGGAKKGPGESPARTGGSGRGLPSLPSALRREVGDGSADQSSVLPTTLQSAIPPPNEWSVKKPTKPGSFLRVLWKKDPATRANFAWWDSEDGLHGGKMLRCSVLENDRRAIKEFELFPSSGDGAEQVISIVTSSEQTVEVPYVTFSFLSADEVGPPGMVFVAPQGVQFPIDALWIKPSLEKQLERKQMEQQRANDEVEMNKTQATIEEIKVAAERREGLERRNRQETKLKGMLACARVNHAPLDGSSRPASGLQEEFATWKQLNPIGLPPPPQKHAITLLYEFEVQKEFKVQKQVSTKSSGERSAENKEQAEPEEEKTALVGNVLTLEVWSHNFTERYNIFLSARNAINGAEMKLETLGYTGLKWFRTHIFDAQTSPSARDSPALCYDGKGGLLFFGGKTKGGDYKTYFNDLWRFDYQKNQWHMYEESVRVYDRGWKESVGLKVAHDV